MFTPTKIINVSLTANYPKTQVGKLLLKDRKIYFEYAAEFLSANLEISPFKLPLQAGVQIIKEPIFNGLFGVFYDSLPDGWGRLLLDRKLQTLKIESGALSPLDRLACVGKTGMGALCYEPDYAEHSQSQNLLNLDLLAAESRQVLEGSDEEFFADLFALNGSSGGARPKVLVGVDKTKRKLIYGVEDLPQKFTHWLIKFPAFSDLTDIGAIEFAYNKMARDCGLRTPEIYLFPAKKGVGFFGSKRFDREGKRCLHMHSLAGLLHADFRVPALDYEAALRATQLLTKNIHEVAQMFRLAVFNVFAHNRDDHGKNIGFLLTEDGSWSVAPAYDLTFSSGPMGEHSTTILGEGRAPNAQHLLALAEKSSFSKKTAQNIIAKTQAVISQWETYAKNAGVSRRSMQIIKQQLL